MNDKRLRLRKQWHEIDGTDIPARLELLGDEAIEAALAHLRKTRQPVTQTSGNDDSLEFWDAHKQH